MPCPLMFLRNLNIRPSFLFICLFKRHIILSPSGAASLRLRQMPRRKNRHPWKFSANPAQIKKCRFIFILYSQKTNPTSYILLIYVGLHNFTKFIFQIQTAQVFYLPILWYSKPFSRISAVSNIFLPSTITGFLRIFFTRFKSSFLNSSHSVKITMQSLPSTAS